MKELFVADRPDADYLRPKAAIKQPVCAKPLGNTDYPAGIMNREQTNRGYLKILWCEVVAWSYNYQ